MMSLLLLACSVCLTADGERRPAYYAATALLLAAPAVMSGVVGLWLHHHLRGRTGGPPRSGEDPSPPA